MKLFTLIALFIKIYHIEFVIYLNIFSREINKNFYHTIS